MSDDLIELLRDPVVCYLATDARFRLANEIDRNRAAVSELVEALKYARSNGIFATFVISDLDAVIHKHQPTTKE